MLIYFRVDETRQTLALEQKLYDTIRNAIPKCAQKLTLVSLIYRTEPKTKMWKRRTEKKKTDKVRSIGKQSGESVESVLEKKKEATMGRICKKEGF